jgi:hypothetical protein
MGCEDRDQWRATGNTVMEIRFYKQRGLVSDCQLVNNHSTELRHRYIIPSTLNKDQT